ncbi:MAG: hypothetical protein J6Q38_03555 [Clostridia bacterium]|nr:hypothetical protein [Clostridia bacterium]
MTIQELMPFLQKVSVDVIVFALITFIITNVIKKYIPEKYSKLISILPFLLGILFSTIYLLIVNKSLDFLVIIEKGIQTGGFATFIYAFLKQLLKTESLKTTISNVLKGILDGTTIKTAVEKILESYSEDNSLEDNAEVISKIIIENTQFSVEESQAISKIIVNALKTK